MEQRYFTNTYEDYKGQPVQVDENYVRNLIKSYVKQIVENTQKGDSRGDLYVGDAGAILQNITIFWHCFIKIFQLFRNCIYVLPIVSNQ